MNKLTRLYQGVLESMGCVVAEDGYVFIPGATGEEPVPFMVNEGGKDKHLALPTKAVLRAGEWDTTVAFHPGCESIAKGQSEVLNAVLDRASIYAYTQVQTTVITILGLAQDKSKHGKMNLKQMKIIGELEGVSNTTMKYLQAIINKGTGIYGARPLLKIHLGRGKEVDGVKYSRSCTLVTPILDEPDPIYGIKASTKSQEAVRRAYELAFPEVKAIGSNAKDAPYFNAMLEMYINIARHLNEIRSALGKYAGNMIAIDLSWIDELPMLAKYTKQYLPQPLDGNTGAGVGQDKAPVDEVVETVTASDIVIPTATAPKQAKPQITGRSTKIEPTVRVVPEAAPAIAPQVATEAPVTRAHMTAAQPVPSGELTLEQRLNGGGQPQGYGGHPALQRYATPVPAPTQQTWQQPMQQQVHYQQQPVHGFQPQQVPPQPQVITRAHVQQPQTFYR